MIFTAITAANNAKDQYGFLAIPNISTADYYDFDYSTQSRTISNVIIQ